MSEWISVKNRLPDNDDFVLVIVSGKAGNITLDNAIELAQFSMDEGWILEMLPEWEDPNVTYWTPLPEPPEVVMTNADRIRAMSDEELAKMMTFGAGTFDCYVCWKTEDGVCDMNCEERCLEWLRLPVEDTECT